MGNAKTTVQKLKIVRVDVAENLLLIKGAVPGHKNSIITIKKSVKA
jgi:large subunit ribosomal protein L3